MTCWLLFRPIHLGKLSSRRHGSRGGQLESTGNIKILVLAPDPVATRILDEVKRKMAQGYALVAFMHEVHVVNPVSAQADTVSV